MNPSETLPSATSAKKLDLLERAIRLRAFCGKLSSWGIVMALGSLISGFAASMSGHPGLMVVAVIGVPLGIATVIAAVAWAGVAILLESIGRGRKPRGAS